MGRLTLLRSLHGPPEPGALQKAYRLGPKQTSTRLNRESLAPGGMAASDRTTEAGTAWTRTLDLSA